jgi:ectoine hydroxylase-related dioxygenase (phytanoyl-CoA dioxygenase family)
MKHVNESISVAPAVHDVSAIVKEVHERGLACVPNVFSASECKLFCEVLDGAVAKMAAGGGYFGSRNTQVIYNYFAHDERLYQLFAHDLMVAVMTELIDKDFVLISPAARNPRQDASLPYDRVTSGEGWHVDSRVCDPHTGALFRPSFSYYAVVALEPFRRENAATHFVPKSHLEYRKPPDRNADYPYEVMEADAGSVVFFDSALWHRTGVPTEKSRWSIFNMYGPWFMKPYFRFRENFTAEQIARMPPVVKRLLHLHSTPPVDPNIRTNTVTAEPVLD